MYQRDDFDGMTFSLFYLAIPTTLTLQVAATYHYSSSTTVEDVEKIENVLRKA